MKKGQERLTKVRVSSFAAAALAAFAAIAFVPPTAARAALIGVSFTETRTGGTETLSVSGYPGATIAGATDNWTITLPGITLSGFDFPQVWVEAAGDPGFNVLSYGGSDVIDLRSEDTTPPVGANDYCGTGAPLHLGVSCHIGTGGGNSYYASVNEKTAVPEPASLVFFGTALLGLGFAARHRRNPGSYA